MDIYVNVMDDRSKQIDDVTTLLRRRIIRSDNPLQFLVDDDTHFVERHQTSDKDIIERVISTKDTKRLNGRFFSDTLLVDRQSEEEYINKTYNRINDYIVDTILTNSEIIAEWYVDNKIYTRQSDRERTKKVSMCLYDEMIGHAFDKNLNEVQTNTISVVLAMDQYDNIVIRSAFPEFYQDYQMTEEVKEGFRRELTGEKGFRALHDTDTYKNGSPLFKTYLDARGRYGDVEMHFAGRNDREVLFINWRDGNDYYNVKVTDTAISLFTKNYETKEVKRTKYTDMKRQIGDVQPSPIISYHRDIPAVNAIKRDYPEQMTVVGKILNRNSKIRSMPSIDADYNIDEYTSKY